MKTILVSGASGIVGYGVLKSLRQANDSYRLIGTTIYNDSVAPAFCDIFEQAPFTSDERYIDWLREMIAKYQVDMLIPGIDADMQAWNELREQIIITGALPLLNNPDLIAACSDKWLFYEKLQASHSTLAIPSRLEGTYGEIEAEYGIPFLLKPRRGFASKGIVRVESEADFAEHQSSLGELVMAQPIIGRNDEEYSISAFFDSDSQLCCWMSLKRTLAKEGYTEKAVVATPEGAEKAIRDLATQFQPVGPTNFQFRVKEEKLKLLEINPRVSSATSIRAAFGYNESVMSAAYFLSQVAPSQPIIRGGYAVRYVEDQVFYDSPVI